MYKYSPLPTSPISTINLNKTQLTLNYKSTSPSGGNHIDLRIYIQLKHFNFLPVKLKTIHKWSLSKVNQAINEMLCHSADCMLKFQSCTTYGSYDDFNLLSGIIFTNFYYLLSIEMYKICSNHTKCVSIYRLSTPHFGP